ncbi:AT-hook motif nuclear-localized protein 14 [Solanum pennellii]|uniref:AT-hook motif nuclear-localized protein n=1 Tax=Solanum pennellii TaxID=28526 RepID=A0ABM1FM24_SOLPN|nr:AT-hook motif nuclear-localized protein 14 [Solanum pennellii]
MEPNETSGLNSYFHHHIHHQPPPSQPPQNPNPTTTTTTTNGIVSINNPTANANANATVGAASHMVYTGSLPSAVSPTMESVKRKRGRPRKYSTPEQAAAAKRLSSASAPPKKRDHGLSHVAGADGGGGSSKKSQLAALGNAGQGFTPHIITVSAGEDVGQKIMMFMQQSKHELCILSASGSVSNASLRQPATSGGSITYEGRFDILTLAGSYVRTETGGRTGGLSVCLASNDGQIIGGGVGGPLIAGGPIQVIVGSFSVDSKTGGLKHDTSAQFGGSPLSFRPMVDSSNQSMGGGQFMMPSRGMQPTPLHSTDWRVTTGQGLHQSPENGDYDHLQD